MTSLRASSNVYVTTGSAPALKTSSQFGSDVRALGVVVLEMLVAVSEYNYRKTRRRLSSSTGTGKSAARSRNSSTCSADVTVHSSADGQTSAKLAEVTPVPRESVTDSVFEDTMTSAISRSAEERLNPPQKPVRKSDKSLSKSLLLRSPSIESYLEPVTSLREYSNVKDLQRIQQRALPPIPIGKVMEDVQSACSVSVDVNRDDVTQQQKHVDDINTGHVSAFSAPEKRDRSSHVMTSPKPKLAPKPNLLKSLQKAQLVNQLELKITDARTQHHVKSPPFRNSQSTGSSSNIPKMTSHFSFDNPVFLDEIYNQSVTSGGSFETIYEDDETEADETDVIATLNSATQSKNKLTFSRSQHVKRKQMTSQSPKIDVTATSATYRQTRASSGSFTNESVLSNDSGLGSGLSSTFAVTSPVEDEMSSPTNSLEPPPQHETLSKRTEESTCAPQRPIKSDDAYSLHSNEPGSRGPITSIPPVALYDGDSSSYVSDPDSYSLLLPYLEKAAKVGRKEEKGRARKSGLQHHQLQLSKTRVDSGIESAVDSCDEHVIKQQQLARSSCCSDTEMHDVTVTCDSDAQQVFSDDDNLCDVSESLPDLVQRKKPCSGQHRHIKGLTCCDKKHNHNRQQPDNSDTKPTKPRAPKKPVRTLLTSKSRHVTSRSCVDEATMTSASLERRRRVSESAIQTDASSCASYVTTHSNSAVKDDTMSLSSAGNSSTQHLLTSSSLTSLSTSKRQPRLGITAVSLARSNPSPASVDAQPQRRRSTSDKSDVTGSRVTSPRSLQVLERGSLNSSMLSLLHESNLFVSSLESLSIDKNNYVTKTTTANQLLPPQPNSPSSDRLLSSSSTISVTSSRQRKRSTSSHKNSGSSQSEHAKQHPVVRHILQKPESREDILHALQTRGFLGYTSAQVKLIVYIQNIKT